MIYVYCKLVTKLSIIFSVTQYLNHYFRFIACVSVTSPL